MLKSNRNITFSYIPLVFLGVKDESFLENISQLNERMKILERHCRVFNDKENEIFGIPTWAYFFDIEETGKRGVIVNPRDEKYDLSRLLLTSGIIGDENKVGNSIKSVYDREFGKDIQISGFPLFRIYSRYNPEVVRMFDL